MIKDIKKRDRRNVFIFRSSDDDGGYCKLAGWTILSVKDANLILARGALTINNRSGIVISNEDDKALYWELMEWSMPVASRCELPMLMSNPDKVRLDPGNKTPMPGPIGDVYEWFVSTTNCYPVRD